MNCVSQFYRWKLTYTSVCQIWITLLCQFITLHVLRTPSQSSNPSLSSKTTLCSLISFNITQAALSLSIHLSDVEPALLNYSFTHETFMSSLVLSGSLSFLSMEQLSLSSLFYQLDPPAFYNCRNSIVQLPNII